jgi:hypothetical protein
MSEAAIADVSRETEGLMEGDEPLPEMPLPGAKTGDPVAPYGFTTDGKVRGRPGRKPGARKATGAGIRKAIQAPPKKAPARPAPPPKKTATDYRPALMSLTGDLIGSAALWGLMRDDMTIIADTATVWRAAPTLIDGLNTAADRFPVIATVLDRFLPLAEFGKSGGAAVLCVAQLAVNHKMMPPGLIPGTTTVEALASSFITEMVKTNEDFAAAVAAIQEAQAARRAGPSDPGLN